MGSETRSMTPVLDNSNACLGHILKSCKGWRAFDAQDRELGLFDSQSAAGAAVLGGGRPRLPVNRKLEKQPGP